MVGVEHFNTIATTVFVSGKEYPYGVGVIDSRGIVRKFAEKPLINMATSTGLYMWEPEVFEWIEKKIDLNTKGGIEFESVIYPELAKAGKMFSMVIPPDVWLPINTQKDYEKAEKVFREYMEKATSNSN